MNDKNQKRELTYNEAKALLEQMYAKGDVEFAKELWGGKQNENEQPKNQPAEKEPEWPGSRKIKSVDRTGSTLFLGMGGLQYVDILFP